jgi:hypothetical protein
MKTKISVLALALSTLSFQAAAQNCVESFGALSVARGCGSSQVAFTPLPNAPTDPTFTYANGAAGTPFAAQGLYRHPLNAPAPTATLVGAIPAGTGNVDLLVGIDGRPDGSLIALAGFNTATPASRLVNVSSTNGALSTIANVTGVTGIPIGLAVNPVSGAAIMGSFDTTAGTGGTRFYNLNTTTGVATLIGTGVVTTDIIIELSTNCAGEVFGLNSTTDRLVRINPMTGAITPAPTAIGIDVSASVNGNGMDFDNTTGTLYAYLTSTAAGAITGSLYGTVNTTTGVNTGTSLGNSIGAVASPSICAPTGAPAITPVTPAGTILNNGAPAGSNTVQTNLSFRNGTGANVIAGTVSCALTGATAGVTISPTTMQTVAPGASTTFSVIATGTPGASYTGTVTCTVQGLAAPVVYTVNGTFSPVTQLNTLSPFSLAALGLLMIGFGVFASRRFS